MPIIYTAIYWWYDNLKVQPKQTVECEFLCFTDDDKMQSDQYQIAHMHTLKHLHPRMQAKFFRTHPILLAKEEWQIMIRLDGSCQIKSEKFVEEIVKRFEEDKDLELINFIHPVRDDILGEAEFSLTMEKYKWLPLIEQAMHYIENGYKRNSWLSATWMLAFRITRKITDVFNARWNENLLWSYQDQISFDITMDLWKVKRSYFWDIVPFNIWNNPYVDFLTPHSHEW